MTRPITYNSIIELLGHCKGGNFNIHFWTWFGYFFCSKREIRFYLFVKESRSCFSRANVRAFHENPDCIYTEPLKHISQKNRLLLSSAEIFEASSTNSVKLDQTSPVWGP